MDMNCGVFRAQTREGCLGLYFPWARLSVTVREGSGRMALANLTALRYSGRPAPAVFNVGRDTTSDVASLLQLDPSGTLSLAAPLHELKNLTATIEARYMGNVASTEVHIQVLPALPDPCQAPLQEVCFPAGETSEFRVYEESHRDVVLLDLAAPPTTSPSPCKDLPQPKYALKGGEGGLAGLAKGRLVVNPSLAKDDLRLTLTCALGKGSLTRDLKVGRIPARVQLPLLPPDPVSRRLVPNITQGEEVLLTWAAVERGGVAVLQPPDPSAPYRLSLERKDFTADLLNATLLLVKLTWTKNSTKLYVKVPARIITSSKNPVELWTEVEVKKDAPAVRYPRGLLRVTPSPFARVAQPLSPAGRLQFQAVLPEILESPYEVTLQAGILYLADWSVQAIGHTADQPGSLVEWRLDGRGVGLAWLDLSVATVDCKEWDICSEARSEKACTRPACRMAASPLQRGRCEWRNNTSPQSLMTRHYATCSPDLSTCPDKECDPLERLHPAICSQDCTSYDVSLGTLLEGSRGIGKGRGVCSCDLTGKCHCGTDGGEVVGGKAGRRQHREEEEASQPLAPPKLTASIGPERGKEWTCGGECISLVVAAGSAIIVVFAYLVFKTSRTCKLKKKEQASTEYSGQSLLQLGPTEIRTTTPITEALMHDHEIDEKWEVPRCRLVVEECLGEGEFGRVLRARARDLPNNPGYITVAVKTLKDNAGSAELVDLMSEYKLLKDISHPNVIKLLGACTTPGAPVYIIIEYCALGSLRGYLRRHRNIKTNNDSQFFPENDKITPKDILSFAWQISKGMAYLSEMKLVHRDLAARNILLAAGKVCKISDFGLTRDVYEDDTYLKKSRGRVPVKWMALESLSDHVYTNKSDVWSFGIVLWELVTLGSSPYPGVAVQNLYHLLKDGYRMQKPNNCSDQLYEIMKECWSADPPDRPSFCLLVDKFERMLEDGADYLDCNVKMVSNPSYFGIETGGPSGAHEMEITFKMDLSEADEHVTDATVYENDSVNKHTSYDIPKPITSIVMSDLLQKDEQR